MGTNSGGSTFRAFLALLYPRIDARQLRPEKRVGPQALPRLKCFLHQTKTQLCFHIHTSSPQTISLYTRPTPDAYRGRTSMWRAYGKMRDEFLDRELFTSLIAQEMLAFGIPRRIQSSQTSLGAGLQDPDRVRRVTACLRFRYAPPPAGCNASSIKHSHTEWYINRDPVKCRRGWFDTQSEHLLRLSGSLPKNICGRRVDFDKAAVTPRNYCKIPSFSDLTKHHFVGFAETSNCTVGFR